MKQTPLDPQPSPPPSSESKPTSGEVEIVPATRRDIETFHPAFRWTFRAIAARKGDETLGIGGVYYDSGSVIAFSVFKPEMNDHPQAKVRALRKILKIMGTRPCLAMADPNIPGSAERLERLGFEHIEGNLYRWM